jgi:hypothetical protein
MDDAIKGNRRSNTIKQKYYRFCLHSWKRRNEQDGLRNSEMQNLVHTVSPTCQGQIDPGRPVGGNGTQISSLTRPHLTRVVGLELVRTGCKELGDMHAISDWAGCRELILVEKKGK